MPITEGPMRTGGRKISAGTPRPATKPTRHVAYDDSLSTIELLRSALVHIIAIPDDPMPDKENVERMTKAAREALRIAARKGYD